MFDFPNSPSEGQIFSPAGGPTYVFNSPVWRAVGQGQIAVISDNRVVNGAMQISQENGTVANNTSAYYGADQWSIGTSGLTGLINIQQNGGVASPAVTYMLHACATAQASIGAAGYWILQQYIEGNRVRDFEWGTAGAKPAVLRFWVNCNLAGTYSVALRNQPNTESFTGSFDVSAGEAAAAAGTYFEKIIPVPAWTSGTWATDSALGVILSICLACGTDRQRAAGWASAGTSLAVPTQVNFLSSTANRFRLKNVGLYLDPNNTGVPPAWQTPDYASELLACQRYCFISSGAGSAAFRYSAAGTSADAGYVSFPVPVRVAPSISFSTPTYSNCSALTASPDATGLNGAVLRCTVTATGQYRANITSFTANARM